MYAKFLVKDSVSNWIDASIYSVHLKRFCQMWPTNSVTTAARVLNDSVSLSVVLPTHCMVDMPIISIQHLLARVGLLTVGPRFMLDEQNRKIKQTHPRYSMLRWIQWAACMTFPMHRMTVWNGGTSIGVYTAPVCIRSLVFCSIILYSFCADVLYVCAAVFFIILYSSSFLLFFISTTSSTCALSLSRSVARAQYSRPFVHDVLFRSFGTVAP